MRSTHYYGGAVLISSSGTLTFNSIVDLHIKSISATVVSLN